MSKDPTILLDMDGVCADFANASLSIWGKSVKDLPQGSRDIPYFLGISTSQFWKEIDSRGQKFWASLSEYPWFRQLYSELERMGDIIFCTSPPRHNPSYAVEGKMGWLRKRFGNEFNSVIFTEKKEFVASEDKLLIDDYTRNVASFVTHGGMAHLFKMKWNSLARQNAQERLYDCLENVEKQINKYRHSHHITV